MRILVVEDDPSVAQILKILLVSHGYAVEIATDGQMGLELAEAFEYDLILLDILLPKLDGITLCKQLRSDGYQMPILLLTGQGGSGEKVAGLDTGADDYVVKPFDQEELIARIRALLRRGHISSQPILEWGNLRLDPSSREVTYGTHVLALTPKEYGLVEMFLRNPRLTFSLGMILEHLWTFEEAPGEDAVRVHMKTLRQKLKAAGAPLDLIETVYGVGYRLNPLLSSAKSSPPVAELEAVKPETKQPETKQPETKQPVLSNDATSHPATSHPLHEAELLLQSPNLVKPLSEPDVPRVLIVEPDAHTRSLLKTLLEQQGVRITLFDDCPNLPETLAHQSPDLLLLAIDLSLHSANLASDRSLNRSRDRATDLAPVNGLVQCQLLRRDDRWRSLPILLITPLPDVALVHQIFEAGASDFVTKPIVGPELWARVGIHLEAAQLRQRIAVLVAHSASDLVNPSLLPGDRSHTLSLPDFLR